MKYKIIALITLIIGIGICIYSVKYYKTEQQKHDMYIETVAVVKDYYECELSDGDTGLGYIAEYKIERNTYQIKSLSCATHQKAIGKEVKIKYNPRNPEEAVFSNDISRYLLPSVGIIFIFAAGIIFKKYA